LCFDSAFFERKKLIIINNQLKHFMQVICYNFPKKNLFSCGIFTKKSHNHGYRMFLGKFKPFCKKNAEILDNTRDFLFNFIDFTIICLYNIIDL